MLAWIKAWWLYPPSLMIQREHSPQVWARLKRVAILFTDGHPRHCGTHLGRKQQTELTGVSAPLNTHLEGRAAEPYMSKDQRRNNLAG